MHLKLQQKYISVIINNTASGKGGALLLDWGSAYVVDSNITGNEAIDGGGIWLYTSVFSALRTDFSYNGASDEGGGFFKSFSDDK